METGGTIRILHVDDDPDFADLTTTFLEREDDRFAIETATAASDGLDRLAENRFDCVISDYDMPGQNGIEFLEAVREDYPDLPFVLFTGKGSEEVASEAVSMGVTDYLQKETGTDQYTVLANRVQNVVERREADRERKRQLEAIETAQEGISILDEDRRFVYLNQTFADLHGYEPGELIGEHWERIYRDEDIPTVRTEILPEVEQVGYWHGETTSLRPDGSTVVVDHTLSKTDQGELICTMRDISERKEREQELRQKTARLEVLFENSPDMVNVHDTEGNIIEPNSRLCEKTGYDASELTEMTVWDLDQEIGRDEAYAMWEEMDVGDRRRLEGVFQHADGSTFPVEVHVRRLRIEGEDRFIVISRDITEQKERERELRRAERRFDAMFNDPNILVGLLDTDGTVTDINETAMEYVDVETADVTGEPFWETPWWSEADRTVIREKVEQAAEGEYVEYESHSTGLDREPYSVEGVIRPVTDDDEVVSLIVSARDVTAMKERERRLQQYERIVEAMDDVAFVVNDDWTVEFVNGAIQEYADVPPESLEGQPVMRLADQYAAGDAAEQFEQALERTFRTGSDAESPERVELTLGFDGETPTFEYQFSPLVSDGETAAAVITMRDITERKRREQRLERQNKRFDELASAVSHDLQTPLATARGRAELAVEDGDTEQMEQAVTALKRADELREDIVEVLRTKDVVGETEPVDVERIGRDIWGTVQASGDASLQIHDAPSIEADPDALRRLLENLLTNAIEHGAEDVTVRIGKTDDGFFVEDDGPGIPEDDREEVFTPGYSTKSSGGGVGLASVRQIVTAHDWGIHITESDDGGARFEITGVAFTAE
ncbi:MAG: PAS domain S-box protein [Halolamina sp.]